MKYKVTICKEYIVEASNEGKARYKAMQNFLFDTKESQLTQTFKIEVNECEDISQKV